MRFRILRIPGQVAQQRYVIQIRVLSGRHILLQLEMTLELTPGYVGMFGKGIGAVYLRFLGVVCTAGRGWRMPAERGLCRGDFESWFLHCNIISLFVFVN